MFEGLTSLFGRRGPGRRPPPAAWRRRDWIEKAVAGIDEALIATDAVGRVTFLNAAAEGLTGWTFAKAVGRPLDEVVPLSDKATHARVESPLAVLERQGDQAAWIRHTVLAARDGRTVPIDYRGAWIRGENAHADGAVFLLRDASVRNQVEEAMARMAAIVENSEDAIVGIALDGAIMTWNAGAVRLYGYTAEEIIGRPLGLLFPPGDQQEQAWIWDRIRRVRPRRAFSTCRSRSARSRRLTGASSASRQSPAISRCASASKRNSGGPTCCGAWPTPRSKSAGGSRASCTTSWVST
jgi:PAS domain S-box-containing protein